MKKSLLFKVMADLPDGAKTALLYQRTLYDGNLQKAVYAELAKANLQSIQVNITASFLVVIILLTDFNQVDTLEAIVTKVLKEVKSGG